MKDRSMPVDPRIVRLADEVDGSRSAQHVFGALTGEDQEGVVDVLWTRVKAARFLALAGPGSAGLVMVIQSWSGGHMPLWAFVGALVVAALVTLTGTLRWRAQARRLNRLQFTQPTPQMRRWATDAETARLGRSMSDR